MITFRRVLVVVLSVVLGFFLLTYFYLIPNSNSNSNSISTDSVADPTYIVPTLAEVKARWEADAKEGGYVPFKQVAFAIPTGGRAKRSDKLRAIVLALVTGGVPKGNVFVFEDEMSRPDQSVDPGVKRIADQFGVNLITTGVTRGEAETSTTFGRYLARHYHFMLDFLFLGLPQSKSKGIFEFAVILEDDLGVGTDTVKFFHFMSRVMRVDPTLFCVCAHQDNAFPATSADPIMHKMDELGFDFRRGNHFMAPGWMTSGKIYRDVVRPTWLDDNGVYINTEKFGLKNGHWDRFWDTRIQQRECIFPEMARVLHLSGEGFTVNKKGQQELYSNIQLSDISPNVDYGDLIRLTAPGYEEAITQFIKSAIWVNTPEVGALYRKSNIVIIVPTMNDQDTIWNSVMVDYFGLIGVGGYGGNPKYAKLRGVHKGSVFVRWMGNLVLLVGLYSPYLKLVPTASRSPELSILPTTRLESYIGCYSDGHDRDLPFFVKWLLGHVDPIRCMDSCGALGYKYAGLQGRAECWCGNSYGKHGKKLAVACDTRCGGNPTLPCGEAWANSVYSATDFQALNSKVVADGSPSPSKFFPITIPDAPPGLLFATGAPGESCVDVCLAKKQRCAAEYLPIIHRSCDHLRALLGCKTCMEAPSVDTRMIAPAAVKELDGDICYLSRGKDLRCDSQSETLRRACVCKPKIGQKI